MILGGHQMKGCGGSLSGNQTKEFCMNYAAKRSIIMLEKIAMGDVKIGKPSSAKV